MEPKPKDKDAAQQQYVRLKRKLEDLEEVHRDGKRQHAAEIEKTKGELERIRKANKEQVEQIARFKKHSELTETRVQDLKKSVAEAQVEARDLRMKLRNAENERDRLVSKQGETADLRKALVSAEAERKDDNQESQRRLRDLQKSLTLEKERVEELEAKLKEQKKKAEKEASDSRVKLNMLESNLERTKKRLKEEEDRNFSAEKDASSTKESLHGRIEQLQDLVKTCAEQYAHLASTSKSLAAYQDLQFEGERLKLCITRLERKLTNSNEQVQELAGLVRHSQVANSLLRHEIRDASHQLRWYSREPIVNPDSQVQDNSDLERNLNEILEGELHGANEEHSALSSVLRKHTDRLQLHYAQLLDHFDAAEANITRDKATILRKEAIIKETSNVVTKLSDENDKRQSHANELVAEIESLNKDIFGLQSKVANAEKALLEAESRARTELTRKEDALRKERDLASRQQSIAHKAKMAEDALKAEIERLTASLADAETYREAYQGIAEEMRTLIARNDLAEDEAHRLSEYNAEILGHTNPTQKILYVDRIRRELAEAKQNLAVVTQDHESALSEILQLRDELAMYKAITTPFEGKPRTNMTRVRRVPFNPQNLNVNSQSESTTDSIGPTKAKSSLQHFVAQNAEMTVDELDYH